MSHHISAQRSQLQLEHLEDRCTPSTLLNDPWVDLPTHHGSPHVAAAASANATHAVPIKLAIQCSADINTGIATVTGFGTILGPWTAQGHIDSAQVDPVADRAAITGTVTVVTANGDQLFVSFSSSWQLSTGKGEELITITGGTGRFAGASGSGSLECQITADPSSPFKFSCNCEGSGDLILAHR
jgi:hypothetical protein